MFNTLLFEIPVYRVSGDDWLADVECRVSNWVERHLRNYPNPSHDDRARAEHLARRIVTQGEGYQYNQVIAWIRLEWDGPGPVVKGYSFRVPLKRINRVFRRTYEFEWKVLEVWFLDETSEEIAAQLRKELLTMVKRGSAFQGRYIDLEAFDTLAPYVDWRRLIGLEP